MWPAEDLINALINPKAVVNKMWTGLRIIGRHLDDPMVLRASAAIDTAEPWRNRWPPIVE